MAERHSAAALTANDALLRHSHISVTPTASVTAACSVYAVATDPPHMRTQENVLWILCQPGSPASSTTTRVNWVEAAKASQMCGPKAKVATSTNSTAVAVAAANVRQRPVAASTNGIINPNCGL